MNYNKIFKLAVRFKKVLEDSLREFISAEMAFGALKARVPDRVYMETNDIGRVVIKFHEELMSPDQIKKAKIWAQNIKEKEVGVEVLRTKLKHVDDNLIFALSEKAESVGYYGNVEERGFLAKMMEEEAYTEMNRIITEILETPDEPESEFYPETEREPQLEEMHKLRTELEDLGL